MNGKNRQSYIDFTLDFILNSDCTSFGERVMSQAKKCFFDLACVLCAGAKNNSSKSAASYAMENFGLGGGVYHTFHWRKIQPDWGNPRQWYGRECP